MKRETTHSSIYGVDRNDKGVQWSKRLQALSLWKRLQSKCTSYLLTNEKSKYHITYVNFPQPSLRLVNNYDYRACCVQVGTAENKVTYL
jgi:hypothetical protein